MKVFLAISLILSVKVSAQTIALIPFDPTAFRSSSGIPENMVRIEDIIRQVNATADNDTSKFFLIAGWIHDNLSFDVNRLDEGGNIPSYDQVLKSRKGLCGDYAALFSELCTRLKLENEIIEGYVQEMGAKEIRTAETNHAWNVVKLGTEWFHCDLLWMSGSIKNTAGGIIFNKSLNTDMFLTRSNNFLKTHIPADPMWQLTNTPHSFSELMEGGDLSNDSSANFDYKKAINDHMKLSKTQKQLKFADNAYKYNSDNFMIGVISNLNAAVELMNTRPTDKKKLQTSKEYLLKAKSHLPRSGHSYGQIEVQIDRMLQAVRM